MRRRSVPSRARTYGRRERHAARVHIEHHITQCAWTMYALAMSCVGWMVFIASFGARP